jgi:hypothetical protein
LTPRRPGTAAIPNRRFVQHCLATGNGTEAVLVRSPDPREKALGLKALDMVYEPSGSYGRDDDEVDRVCAGGALSVSESGLYSTKDTFVSAISPS